jgi:pyroglutamyl-peptidase
MQKHIKKIALSNTDGCMNHKTTNMLLTGFGPFLNYTYNPSGEIAKKLDGKTIMNTTIVGKLLLVEHKEVRKVLENYVEEYKPAFVVALGLAGGRGCISLERIAINRYYFRNDKEEFDEPLYENGPSAYFSGLPLKEIKASLQNHGIPAEYSFFPDTFVSNEVFYEVMRLSDKIGIRKAGFVHLPLTTKQVVTMEHVHYATREKIPSMEESMLEKAVRIIIQTTLNADSK